MPIATQDQVFDSEFEHLASQYSDVSVSYKNAEGINPTLLDQAKDQYPVLKDYDIGYKDNLGRGQGYMESWPPNETGTPDRPRPEEFPIGQFGVENYKRESTPTDVTADIVSHHLVNVDPTIKEHYQGFVSSLQPFQKDILKDQYQYAKDNNGETRPYEEWEKSSGIPAFFRGYAFSQWNKEFTDKAYTPEQRKSFDNMMDYLEGHGPNFNSEMGGAGLINYATKKAGEVLDLVKKPGEAYQGRLTPEQITDAGIGLAGLVSTSAVVPKPGLGIFGGTLGGVLHGKPEGIKSFSVASELEKGGHTPSDIYKQTGWFKGPDNQWRFEFSDSGAKLKTENLKPSEVYPFKKIYDKDFKNYTEEPRFTDAFPGNGEVKTVGDILDHPELYKYYPDIKDVPLTSRGFNLFVEGFYNKTNKGKESLFLSGGTEKEMLSTLLHEVQHAVQAREGFARGGNPGMFHPGEAPTFQDIKTKTEIAKKALDTKFTEIKDVVKEEVKSPLSPYSVSDLIRYKKNLDDSSIHSGVKKEYKDILDFVDKRYPEFSKLLDTFGKSESYLSDVESYAYKRYQQLYGETESRMVQERMGLTEEGLRSTSPFKGETFKKAYPEGSVGPEHIIPQEGIPKNPFGGEQSIRYVRSKA